MGHLISSVYVLWYETLTFKVIMYYNIQLSFFMFKTFPTFQSANLRLNAWKIFSFNSFMDINPFDDFVVLNCNVLIYTSEALGSKKGL